MATDLAPDPPITSTSDGVAYGTSTLTNNLLFVVLGGAVWAVSFSCGRPQRRRFMVAGERLDQTDRVDTYIHLRAVPLTWSSARAQRVQLYPWPGRFIPIYQNHFLQWPSGNGKSYSINPYSTFLAPFCSIVLQLFTVTYRGLFQRSNKSYCARVILDRFYLSNAGVLRHGSARPVVRPA
jgi:hypothetical protein